MCLPGQPSQVQAPVFLALGVACFPLLGTLGLPSQASQFSMTEGLEGDPPSPRPLPLTKTALASGTSYAASSGKLPR